MPRLVEANRRPGDRIRYTLEQIPGGEAGTDATVRKVAQLVDQAVTGQQIRVVALQILNQAGTENHNPAAAAKAIFRWVKHHIRYIRDPIGLETVQAPEVTLRLGAGDCDDHSALVAALATTLAIPARFVVVGPSRGRFVHIYPQLFVGDAWRNADTTMRGRFAGAMPKLPVEKIYTVKGSRTMGLGENVLTGGRALPIHREQLYSVAYNAAKRMIRNNWVNGVINRSDIEGYVRVIDEGNSPLRRTFADPAMRQAAIDMLGNVNATGELAPKGEGAGMGDLSGFLGSVVGAVVGAVKGAVKSITGKGDDQSPIQITMPDIVIPKIETTIPPQTAQAGIAAIFSNPVTLIALAGLAALLVMRR